MKIVQYPHPALRYHARPLTIIDNKVRAQAAEMLALMYESKGVGLAATQVALPFQMFVMNWKSDPAEREAEHVFINPQILERKGTVEGEEGCLSFPGLYQKVRRAKHIVVRAYNLKGDTFEQSLDDMEARIVQHEADHLHGILFIDKMGTIAKLASRGRLKELERDFRKQQERGEMPPDAALEQALEALAAPT